MGSKYVIFSDGQREFAVIFDRALGHKDVADGVMRAVSSLGWSKLAGTLVPVSAGFVGDSVKGSESLRLEPRPEDAALLSNVIGSNAVPLPPPPAAYDMRHKPPQPQRSLLDKARTQIRLADAMGNRTSAPSDSYNITEALADALQAAEAKLLTIQGALELIARGYENGQSFSGTNCRDIAQEALKAAQ